MNKFAKMAVVAAGVALIAQGAQAAFLNNDLYLGFTSAGAASDLIIDLGQGSTMSGGSVIDLSADLGGLSTFNTIFGNSSTGVSMAVVGGVTTFNQQVIWGTALRVGGAGNATTPGSNLSASSHTSTSLGGAAQKITGLASTVGGLPTAGHMVTDTGKSYSSSIENVANSYSSNTGFNPASPTTGGIVMEDLWSGSVSSPYSYKGYFTFDYNNDLLTFTPATLAAVPEPATYGLFAGAGLLALSLRRQFRRKTA